MHDNATRTNHCPDCGTAIHWQAKRCKPCKAKERGARRTAQRKAEFGTAYVRPKPLGIRRCEWCGHDFDYHPKYRRRFCSRRCAKLIRHDGESCTIPWVPCSRCG